MNTYRTALCWGLCLWLMSFGLWGQSPASCCLSGDSLDAAVDALLTRHPLADWPMEADCEPLSQRIVEALSLSYDLPDTLMAQVCHRIGVQWIRQAHDYAGARNYYRQAIELREAHLPAQHPDIIKGYNNLGSCYLLMTQKGEGFFLDSAHWALDLSVKRNLQRPAPTDILGHTYIYLSRVAAERGDTDNARLFLTSAIEHFEQDTAQARSLAIAHNDLSFLISTAFQTPQVALDHALAAISYYDRRLLTSWRDSLPLGDWYVTAGVAATQLDSLPAALTYYQRALRLKAPYGPYLPTQMASIANNQAIVYNRLAQYEQAIERLEAAIALNQQEANDPALAGNYDNLGDAWMGLGQYDQALTAFQAAIRYMVPGFDPTDSLANPPIADGVFYQPIGLLDKLAAKANTLLQRYRHISQDPQDLTRAYQTCLATDSLIQVIRQGYQATGSKAALATLTKPFYETAIQTCLALHARTQRVSYQQTAFALAENSKAVILLDALRQSNGLRQSLSEAKQASLKQLRERKVYYEKRLAMGTAETLSLGDSVIKYRQLEGSFLQDPTQRHQWQSPWTAQGWDAALAELLPSPDHGLLEYFVGDSSLYLFLLTQDRIVVRSIPKDFPLNDLVTDLRQAISSPQALDHLEQSLPVLLAQATELYGKLIAPLGDLDALPEHLTIVRDDILELLPFEVLVSKPVAQVPALADIPYLIKQKVISYTFSANLRLTFQHNVITPHKGLITFAPIEFSQVRAPTGAQALSALFATQGEVEAVAKLMPGSQATYLKGDATLQRFQAEADDYAIIYLASHGVLHERDPRFNGIAFHDAILYTADLSPLTLNAEMVVLRACESGVGQLVPGEGVISLGHGFAQTGAKSIFLTQWVVPDASRFMTRFMANLQKGQPKDLALHQAKLADVAQMHPFFWAAPEIRGDMRPLPGPVSAHPWAAWLALGAGLLLLIIGLHYVRQRMRPTARGHHAYGLTAAQRPEEG